LISEGRIARQPAILSGAGSAWYDVVADEFAQANSDAIEVVLRPGCYLTHDVGIYKKAQNEIFARNPIAKKMGEGLKPALQLWAYVQSIPEPDRAIIGLGKRDSAFDAGMPEPAKHYRPGNEAPRDIASDEAWEIFGLMDQHAYLRIKPGDDLKVGDMIAFDISHPCLTFDKWRQVLVVDSKYRVTEVIETFF
jgi:D-serine dehydratase